MLGSCKILFFAFVFFNSCREVLGGVLKGVMDTISATILHSVGALILGIPLQLVLSANLENKLDGIWYGLDIGMLFVCVMFFYRISNNDYELASFNILKDNEEQQKKRESRHSFDKMLSYKAPPKKVTPYGIN